MRLKQRLWQIVDFLRKSGKRETGKGELTTCVDLLDAVATTGGTPATRCIAFFLLPLPFYPNSTEVYRTYARVLVLLGLTLFLLPTSLTAAPLVKQPLAPPDTSSPRATLRSFVDNSNKAHQLIMGSYNQVLKEPELLPSRSSQEQFQQGQIILERAMASLNLSEIPLRLKVDAGIVGTLKLKEILDRIELPPYAEIPDAVAVAEAVTPDKELTRWRIPQTEIDIVKVESGPRAGEFLFSPKTVARLGEFYQKVKNLPYQPGATEGFYAHYLSTSNTLLVFKLLQALPSWLNVIYWENTLWQWIGLGILLLIGFWITYQSWRWQWGRVVALDPPKRNWLMLLAPLIALASLVAVSYVLVWWFNITGSILLIALIVLEIIYWMMLGLTIFLLGNALAETIIASPSIEPQGLNASLLRTVFRLLGLTIGTTILIIGIEHVGISLIPILTGLGIGGLALALAVRPTLENMIAGIILLADRPVTVGERCRFGNQEGDIQKIGLRSTRILALNGFIISIPNSQFSNLQLTNKSRSESILLRQIVRLRCETTSEQLRFVLTKLWEMIPAHPKLLEEQARVRFVKYGNYSLDVEIFVYVDTGDRDEFLEIQQDVLLRVKDLVETAGTDLAFPSQRAYLSRDSRLDRERSRAAETKVQAWRSKGLLPFPEFPLEERELIRDSVDFAPEGFPNARSDSGKGKNGQDC